MSCRIFFAGDYVLKEDSKRTNILEEELRKIVDNHDISCVNLEGPIIEQNMKIQKKVGPNIYNNKEMTQKLINEGFNLFCLANNHIFDYGKEGIKSTITFLKNNGVNYIGASYENNDMYTKPYIATINDVKVCIMNVAENGFGAAINENYGYAYMNYENINQLIMENKKKSDILILVCHAGAEHWEVPLPEIRKLYKEFIDRGVDVIIGHHTHTPQGWEEYNNGLIFYSLGNFAFNIGNKINENDTYCVSLEIDNEKNISFKILPITYNGNNILINRNENKIKEIYRRKEILEDKNSYEILVQQKCLEDYEKIYKNLYYMVACIYKGGIKQKVKQYIKRYLLRQKFQDKFLYHNLNIESHYWICKRASRLIMKKQNIF